MPLSQGTPPRRHRTAAAHHRPPSPAVCRSRPTNWRAAARGTVAPPPRCSVAMWQSLEEDEEGEDKEELVSFGENHEYVYRVL